MSNVSIAGTTGMNMSVENNAASPLPNKLKKGQPMLFRFIYFENRVTNCLGYFAKV